MKSVLVTSTLIFVLHLANAQKLKLNRTIDIDTLHISLDFDSTIDSFSKSYIDSNFRDAISQFNASEDAFYIVDSLSTGNHFLSMTMRPIQLVKVKGQIINSLYNLALVPYHYFMLKEQKFTLPLLPLFIQAKSRIDYIPSPTLFLHKE
ncbi:hypothetical protein OAD66_07530 [Bacteroidia bacterium]|nr:hypothetical protein [Bacteroidia bacterium]MDB9882967.1 hypothetical protein [Bacteroidia bacterium]